MVTEDESVPQDPKVSFYIRLCHLTFHCFIHMQQMSNTVHRCYCFKGTPFSHLDYHPEREHGDRRCERPTRSKGRLLHTKLELNFSLFHSHTSNVKLFTVVIV